MNLNYLLVAVILYIMIFGIRPFSGFCKKNAKSLDEFTKFVREQNCRYVAVCAHEDMVLFNSDYAEIRYYVIVTTINPFGVKFTYQERTCTYVCGFGEGAKEARVKNNRMTQEIRERIKNNLAQTDKPILISLQTR